MEIMGIRHRDLVEGLAALNQTHIPMLRLVEGRYVQGGIADDPGIYYFIPALAKNFGLPLESAIRLFFGSLALCGLFAAAFVFTGIFKSWAGKFMALAWLFLFEVSTRQWDVYVTQLFAVFTVVSLALFFHHHPVRRWVLVLGMAGAGLACGYSNFIRSQSGTGALMFLLAWLLLTPLFTFKKKGFYALLALACFLLPAIQFKLVERQRDDFLQQSNPACPPAPFQHLFWHPVYIGLGIHPNKYGIEFSDDCAINKVKSIDPNAARYSTEYERVLRNEVIQLAKTDPLFILGNFAWKLKELLGYLLRYAGIGLIAFFWVKPPKAIAWPFLLLALFTSIPPLLVDPVIPYGLGFISTATLFGIYMTGLGLEKYLSRIKKKGESA